MNTTNGSWIFYSFQARVSVNWRILSRTARSAAGKGFSETKCQRRSETISSWSTKEENVLLGVSLDNKRSEVDVQFQFPKDYERYFRLIRYLTTIVSTSSPAICLTVWMGTTCSWPLGPTPTWRGRDYQMTITLTQFLPLSAPVGLRPNYRSVYCITGAALVLSASCRFTVSSSDQTVVHGAKLK